MTERLLATLGTLLVGVAILLVIPIFLIVAPFLITYLVCQWIVVKLTHKCPGSDLSRKAQEIERGLKEMKASVEYFRDKRMLDSAVAPLSWKGRTGPH